MINKFYLHNIFIILCLFSTFIAFFTRSGAIAYSPLIVLMFLIVFSELYSPSKMLLKEWFAIIVFLPYVFIAGLYYFYSPLDGRYLTTNFLAIILLPFFIFSLIFLSNYGDDFLKKYFSKVFLYFLIFELIVCIGQYSTYIWGFGFPVNPSYEIFFMISGTFYNSNDLAVILLLILIVILKLNLDGRKYILIFLIFILLVITGSRSALFLSVMLTLFFISDFNFKLVIKFIVLLFIIYIFYFIFLNNGDDAIARMLNRLSSFSEIYENGFRSDGSINIRLDSYLHFFYNFNELGIGTGEIGDYQKFSKNAQFDTTLMLNNPHFLLVELGYWLGWAGFISFICGLFYFYYFYKVNFLMGIAIFISMCISSSVLGSFIYFLLFFMCFIIGVRKA